MAIRYSEKTIRKHFENFDLSNQDVKTLHFLVNHHSAPVYEKLETMNRILGAFGVECVRSVSGIWLFEFLQTGDAYTPIVVRRRDTRSMFMLSTYGDTVEIMEKKGYKVA